MAVKGKAVKGKSRSGAAPGAPKPKIEPRKPPLSKRPGFRKAAAAVGIILVLLIASSVWGRVSRANDLRSYDRALTSALRPFQKHNESGSPTNLSENVQQIGAGELSAKQITELAQTWDRDFAVARDAVSRLDPPRELSLANTMYAEAMDDYIGIARLASTIAGERRLVARIDDRSPKARAQDQLNAWQSMLLEWQGRADKRRGEAQAAIDALKADWGLDGAS